MLIAIITDPHFGVRGDSQIFLDHQEKFFSEIFFPYIDQHNITTVLNLGDTFDRRKYINFNTLARVREFYFGEMAKRNIAYHAVVGNHDVSFKNTNEVNALTLLCDAYPNFYEYKDDPVELTFGSSKILLSPWITTDNYISSMKAIQQTDAHIVAGHFEFAGFEMMKGQLCEHGIDTVNFTRFEQVWSGHFHHPSKHDNIEYLGAPYEMNWTDFNGVRGFHVFDTETRELTRIHNPFKMFHKIYYDDAGLTIEELDGLDPSQLKMAYVKIIVTNKTNPYLFELFVAKIQSGEPFDIKIVEDAYNLESISEQQLTTEVKDTREILHDSIDQYIKNKPGIKREKMVSLLDSLYQEAINL